MMKMTNSQIVKLLQYLGAEKINPYAKAGDEVRSCCPVHGEQNPSFSVSVSKQLFACFSCGTKGHISSLPYRAMPDRFRTYTESAEFLKEKFGVDYGIENLKSKTRVKSYDEFYETEYENRHTIPFYELAAYKSGKETFEYFIERGFTKKTMKKFMIGRDLDLETVTIPVFWEDNELAGIIGRYVDPKSELRYHIYDNFPRSQLLFPLNHFEDRDGEIIIVEGLMDALWMHQHGYQNTLALMGLNISKAQLSLLKTLGDKYTLFFDNDEGGERGIENAKKKLVNTYIMETDASDPQDSSLEQIDYAYKNKKPSYLRKLAFV